ncbi:fibronectin type III domain-containing protein [Hymenobacter sp. BT635]|uniref:Fibronectin type III domain-containing protein n=1 Tax=Hymenobacter nitidus TaxID=2880929 RepID=A0ABS8A7C7_9BACT|nr:fibronectin type III domain-containing protein [Hymenobacter nitidus]MCB2376303.1 fibronectin type III domain-containing protein [Hymenobacter nitidus]
MANRITGCALAHSVRWRGALLFLLSLWLGLAAPARAQVDTYTFAPSQGTFTPISGGTVVAGMAADTYLSSAIPLGFSFVFDGATYTQVKASSNGWLSFNTAGTTNHSGTLAAAPAATRPLIAALLDDLDGNPTGATATGTYITTGTAPNRVFTFEWLNWEWRWNVNTGPVLSFQVKLYEGSNRVEMVYRQETVATNATATLGASIGLAGLGTGSGSYLSLSDATAAPTASSTTENTNINTKPATGQVYAFTPAPLAACPQPRSLSVSAFTNTTATLNWASAGTGTYTIQYGLSGFTPGSSAATTVTSTTNSVSISGLTPSTGYDFYVTQNCGANGNSLISAVASFTTRAVGPPNNDNCAGAVTLTPEIANTACSAATNGTVEGATATAGLATPVGTADDDVWYKFTATSTTHTVTLTGSGDYVQELLSGTCASPVSVAFSDPSVKVYTGLTVGTTYLVRVYSYAATLPTAAAAAFTICVTTTTAPNNDACTSAVTLTPEAPNVACSAATNGTVEGATATAGLAAPVGTADDDVWYKFTATSPVHTITLTGSGDYVQELLSGTCASPVSVAFSDPSVRTYTGLTVGATYLVRVYSYSSTLPTAAAAAFTICVTTSAVPGNDACANAVTLTPAALNAACTSATNGTVEGASGTTGLATPFGTADDDVWYKFTATGASHTITLTGTGNYVQEILSGTCAALVSEGFSDPNERTYNGLTVGATYYVRVYSSGSTPLLAPAANFTICITTPTVLVPPANDECAAAVTLTPEALNAACSAATNGTLENAGSTAGLATPVGTADDDVWYKFTATGVTHTITLTGTGNYVQELLSGTCASLASVGFSDPNERTYNGLTVGTTYYVRVYSSGSTPVVAPAAEFTICVTTPTPILPPANDECAAAVTLTPSATTTCTAATSGTLQAAGATVGLAAPVGTADDDVWYKFTATNTTHIISLTGSGDYVQQVLSGTCGALTSVAFSDPSVRTYTGLTVGTTYYVRVYSYSATIPTAAAAAFTICVTTPPLNDDPCGAITIAVAAGCASPTQGTNEAATTTTPVGYTNPGCGIAASPIDVWFKFTTAASGTASTAVSIISTGTPAGQVRVFSAATCAGPFTQVGCKFNATATAGTLDLSGLTPSTTYYISVSGYSSSSATGAFTLCITPPPTCVAPAGLAVSGVTQTAATLSWSVSAGTGPFTVEYGPAGFTPGSAQGTVVTTTTASLSLTTLTPGTNYQFYVTQNCGGASGNSLRSGPVAFSTVAPPPANDECATATTIAVQLGGSCTTRIVGTNAGATGSTGAPAPGCSSYLGGDVWYRVVVPATGSIIASTDSVAGSVVDDTGMAIYSGACGTLTLVDCDDDAGTGNFSLIELSGRTPGEVLFIRVFEYGNNEFGRFKLCVRSNTTCPAPVGLNASAVASNSARLNWAVTDPIAGATFNVEYGPQGFTPGSSAGTRLTGLTGTFVDVTGLTPSTEYCYYVSQNCGTSGATAGVSAPAGPVCFTTPALVPANNDVCGAITLPIVMNSCSPVTATNVGATTSAPNGYVNPGCTTSNAPKDVWFTMTTGNGSASMPIQFTTTGNPAGQVRIFTAASCSTSMTQVACRASAGNNQTVGSFTVNLTPVTKYYVMVAGWGSNDATGAFTICAQQVVSSNTKELPGGEVSVFPNPSNTGAVTLRIRGAEQTKMVHATLLNTLGQQVLAQDVAVQAGAVEAPLSVKGLATGIYTLRVKVGEYTITRKVVLE